MINRVNLRRTAIVLLVSAIVAGCGSSSDSDSRDRNVGVSSKPCAEGGPCAVGDVGPGGGIVFVGGSQPGVDMWEVAPVNGWGAQAAAQQMADDLDFGGVTDWQLPTKDLLKTLHQEADRFACGEGTDCIGAFAPDGYWTSETSGSDGRVVSFDTGDDFLDTNSASYVVRPVRKFQIVPPVTTTTAAPSTTTTTTIPDSALVKLAVASVSPVCTSWPGGEDVNKSIDGNKGTKFLCVAGPAGLGFGGVDFTLRADSSVNALKLTTANDCPGRDPTGVLVQAGPGSSGPWTTVASKVISLSRARGTQSALLRLDVDGSVGPTRYYRVLFTDRIPVESWDCWFDKGTEVQVSEIELWGVSGEIAPSTTATTSTTTSTSTTTTSTTTTSSSTTTTSTTTTIPATTTTTVPPCDPASCRVGDKGPGGGTIVYDAGSNQSWGRFIEMAPSGWSGTATDPVVTTWCSPKASDRVSLSEDLGAGATNTERLRTLCNQSIATPVINSRAGGKADWVVPSSADMVAVCDYVKRSSSNCRMGNPVVRGFGVTIYWTSSGTLSLGQFLVWEDSDAVRRGGNWDAVIRPVRYFSAPTATTTSTTTTVPRTTTTSSTTTTIPPTTTTTVAPQRDATECRRGGTCVVGDVGPGGGTVFYAAASQQWWGQYLEYAPDNWFGSSSARDYGGLCSKKSGISGSFSNLIGAGKANSEVLKNQCAPDYVCWKCGTIATSYQGNGRTDWYAPSKDEAAAIQAYWLQTRQQGRAFATSNVVNGNKFLISYATGGQPAVYEGDIYSGSNYWNYQHLPIRAFSRVSCANGGFCQIGDTGPGGGVVFYTGAFLNTQTNTMMYNLEMAPNGWATGPGLPNYDGYCSTKSGLRGPFGTAIGTGQANTALLQSQCPDVPVCRGCGRLETRYRGGGKSDWFIPSRDEAIAMVRNLVVARSYSLSQGSIATSSVILPGGSSYFSVLMNGLTSDSVIFTTNYTLSPRRPIRAF